MSEQDQIFEADEAYNNILNDSEDEIETEEPQEIPLIQQEIEEPIVKKDKRRGKRSKPISEEQRKRLCDNLARGRAKALETRRKNAQLKKIEKEQKMDEKEEKLLNALNKKKEKSQGNDDLLKKIADLEKKLLEKESPHHHRSRKYQNPYQHRHPRPQHRRNPRPQHRPHHRWYLRKNRNYLKNN